MKRLLFLLIAGFLLISTAGLKAQSVEDYLSDILANGYGENYIKGYIQPLSTSLGISLGGALYHRGGTKGFPRFDIGLSAVYVPIPEAGKTFKSTNAAIPGNVPTVFGTDKPDNQLAIAGTNADFFALPMLHANVGLIGNLEATARFTKVNLSDVGDLTVYGGGLKYGLSELLPIGLLPLDFSIQAAYHKFTLGDIIDAGTFSMNLQASVSIPLFPVSVYGGAGFDRSSLTVKTDAFDIPGVNDLGDVVVDGKNGLRYNLGVSLTFLLLNVHADYNIGEYNSFGAGVMVVL